MSKASAIMFVVLLGVLVVGGFIAVGTAADTPDNTEPPDGAVAATVSVPGSRVQEELDAGAAGGSYAGTRQGLALLDELTSPKLPDDPTRQPLELTPVNIRLLNKAGMDEFLLDVMGSPGVSDGEGQIQRFSYSRPCPMILLLLRRQRGSCGAWLTRMASRS